MKKAIFFSIAVLCVTVSLTAQRTATYFQKTYKSNKDSTSLTFQSVAATKDGGYALMGNYQNATNFGDMMMIKTDSLGAVTFSSILASDTVEAATGIRQTPDGGYIMCGWNSSPVNFSKGDMLLAKLDSTGKLRWSTRFGGDDVDEAGDVAVLNSGDIVVAGRSPETVGGAFSAYFLLTRSTGVPENGQFVRFGNAPSTFSSIDKTFDGGSIACGYTGSFFQRTGFDPMIVKFNNQGVVQWGKRYATPGTQFSSMVRQTRDSGYVIIGQQAVTQPNGSIPQTFYVIKTKANGDTLFCKAFDTGKFEFAKGISDVSNGYIISGYATVGIDTVRFKSQTTGNDTFATRDRSNAFAMKIDYTGAIKWGKVYGDSTKISRLYASTPTQDGGATLVGETFGYGNTFGAGFVIHIDREGNIGAGTGCQIRNLNFTSAPFTIKDSTNVVFIDSGEENASNLRTGSVTIIKSDICSGTGPSFVDVKDNRLPDNAVRIYPNPAHAQLTVEIEVNNDASTVQIYDVMGRLMHNEVTKQAALTIDVANFTHGLYFLKVEQGGKYATKKFIVE